MKFKERFVRSLALPLAMLIITGCSLAAPIPGEGAETDAGGLSPVPSPETLAPGSPETGGESSVTPSEDAGDTSAGAVVPDGDTDSILQQMTLRQKVGQLFIIRPDSLDPDLTSEQVYDSAASGVKTLTGPMADTLRNYPVGGIVMFAKNIAAPEQLTAFMESFQSVSTVPLFMAVDEEGGLVARLANHPAFDLPAYQSAAAVGSSGDPADALAMGNTIGEYLRRYGFHMDFAPVADVNTNPRNSIIGSRAFSSDADTAAQMALAMAQGLKQQNIIPVFKHFPGHGDTSEDSHNGIAVSHQSKEEMEACEWLAYKALSDMDCVMVGHIAVPDITGDLTPATMSQELVSGILRHRLGFDGLVITDSLAMGAITNDYRSGDAAIKAIEAGCDILLCPYHFQEAFDAVIAAVEDGALSEQRIDESVSRILTLKKAYGLQE